MAGQLRAALALYREKYPCTLPGGSGGMLSMLSIKALAEEYDEAIAIAAGTTNNNNNDDNNDDDNGAEEEEEEEEFSDWDDEEEETVVRGPAGMAIRRPSLTFSDDVVTMHGEMDVLLAH